MTRDTAPPEGGAERTGQVEVHRTPSARHDGATEAQAARFVTDFVAGRERVLGARPMTVGDVSKVLAAMVGDDPPQEPSAARCPSCQAAWTERVDMFPRVRVRTDLSWDCDWCGRTAGPIAEDHQ